MSWSSASGVLAEGAHHGSQLLGGDGTVAILVEEGESLLELGDLFLGECVGGACHCVIPH